MPTDLAALLNAAKGKNYVVPKATPKPLPVPVPEVNKRAGERASKAAGAAGSKRAKVDAALDEQEGATA